MTPPELQRRTFLKGAGLAGLSVGAAGRATAADASTRIVHLYAGAWSGHGGDKGLWLHRFDPETGRITPVKQISGEFDCGFIHIDRDKHLFHCTDESDQPLGSQRTGGGGRIFTYRVDPATGELSEVDRQHSYGSNPTTSRRPARNRIPRSRPTCFISVPPARVGVAAAVWLQLASTAGSYTRGDDRGPRRLSRLIATKCDARHVARPA